MSIFSSPTDLARALGQRRRALKGVIGNDATALLEADDEREVRFYTAVREVAYLVFVWPFVFSAVGYLTIRLLGS